MGNNIFTNDALYKYFELLTELTMDIDNTSVQGDGGQDGMEGGGKEGYSEKGVKKEC